jgi:hypothetical protein
VIDVALQALVEVDDLAATLLRSLPTGKYGRIRHPTFVRARGEVGDHAGSSGKKPRWPIFRSEPIIAATGFERLPGEQPHRHDVVSFAPCSP